MGGMARETLGGHESFQRLSLCFFSRRFALARDLNADRTVDVLGAQLEEVTE
jgi:hypothetical protein